MYVLGIAANKKYAWTLTLRKVTYLPPSLPRSSPPPLLDESQGPFSTLLLLLSPDLMGGATDTIL